MRRVSLLLSVLLISLSSTFAQVVQFKDAKLKSLLVENEEINTNHDKEIQLSEAEAYKGNIKVGGEGITSMQGIEAFINLKGLWCNSNNLSSLDITSNVLTQLYKTLWIKRAVWKNNLSNKSN